MKSHRPNKNVLITGGAGFIGSNLAKSLLEKNYDVTILDNLSPQIHGIQPKITSPLYKIIEDNVNFIDGDVRNTDDWAKSLKDIQIVIHFASETGTGQSMYEATRYCEVNVMGTSLLIDYLTNKKHSIEKVLVASSRAIYGEGKYKCGVHGFVFPTERDELNMKNGDFEAKCPYCNCTVAKVATDEDSKLHPSSIYGITKLAQEEMISVICKSLGIPSVVLRYQNVYGPGQSLSNPYTGILSIFSALIKNNRKINIFEDGLESRDFVFIRDVVDATILGIEKNEANYQVFNVGSGVPITVENVAKTLIELYQIDIPLYISGNFRNGDIRHNFADLLKIKKMLGYSPKYSFYTGISKFVDWVNQQEVDESQYESSLNIMRLKKLLK